MKTLTMQLKSSRRSGRSTRGRFAQLIAIIAAVSMISGCVGIVVNSMGRSLATGETYGEMAQTLAPPVAGNGRLYYYRTGQSTDSSFQAGVGFIKNTTFCTIRGTAYELMWEAFKYIDLPEGNYELTCGSDVLKKQDFWSGKGIFQTGANKVQVSISNALDTFARVDGIEKKPFFQPVLVPTEQAGAELNKLPLQIKPFEKAGGKLSP